MFALVDCNNFYASCERVFNPALRHRPVLVLSNNDGCVIARSNEVKALGIKMGAPYHQVKQLVQPHNIAVFSSNYSLYGDMSHRVMSTIEQMMPEVEVYSIDEAFIGMDSYAAHDIEPIAQKLRHTVKQWTGIPVSVGVAPTKTLAKAANQIAKQFPDKTNGVALFNRPDFVDACLRFLPVGDVWGVGRRSAAKLIAQGIVTAHDLKCADPRDIRKQMTVMGERTVRELNGISCIPLEEMTPDRKGVTVSRSFGMYLREFEDIRHAMTTFATRAGEKLRKQNLAAKHLTVFLRTNPFAKNKPFYSNYRKITLPYATDFTPELIHYAVELLRQIYREGYDYKKCGIMLTDLEAKCARAQGDMFDTRDNGKMTALMQAVDGLNNRYGSHAVTMGTTSGAGKWKGATNLRSPCYTTQWGELMKVGGNTRD